MMTIKKHKELFKKLHIDEKPIKRNEYKKCCKLNEVYWNLVTNYLHEAKPKKVIVVFLESVPEDLDNNMFSKRDEHIELPNDSYLWNICRGFFKIEVCSILTKGEALEVLLKFRCNGENVPVIILDLFPFHGMDLKKGKPSHRSKIINGFSTHKGLILEDVNMSLNKLSEMKVEKYFLFGVPYSIWNGLGGAGQGSLYMDGFDKKEGPLGTFINEHAIRNVGGQGISYNNIVEWRKREGLY
jgi:hypothetical protein